MTKEQRLELLKQIEKQIYVPSSKATLQDELKSVAILSIIDEEIERLEQKPCEDAISRRATIDAIYKKHIGGKDAIENAPINDLYACGLEEAIDAVDNMPSVKPQPKTGHWIGIDEEPHEDYECDRCGYVVSTYTANIEPHTEYKYCPNCGAKMQEVEE